MPDPSSDETSPWVDSPYQTPAAPLATASGNHLLLPLRWCRIGAGIGGSLGVFAVLLVLLFAHQIPEDIRAGDPIGPMVVGFLPLLAVGVVASFTVMGLFAGLLTGGIACKAPRPNPVARPRP